jgi:hypothetical protein
MRLPQVGDKNGAVAFDCGLITLLRTSRARPVMAARVALDAPAANLSQNDSVQLDG